MRSSLSQRKLQAQITQVLKEQGFRINPHVRPPGQSKATLRRIQNSARLEQLVCHKNFLREYCDLADSYCRDGKDMVPKDIELELREVKPDSFEEILFRWWNFVWWSIPYQHPYGRQLRFLLWDKVHNAPFGLVCLQSPVLKMAVRDHALEIPKGELDVWVNRSMSAQRIGALPPYNDLLGGKMVALSVTSNEVREVYARKYKDYRSILRDRKLNLQLLFITTTKAFGKSNSYEPLV